MNKLENTPANKARLFAQYWGQRVIRAVGLSKLRTFKEIDPLRDGDYLELTPLSQITDEDAEYVVGTIECCMRKNDENNAQFGMSPSGIFIDSIIGDNSYHIDLHDQDYLRSKGYALPFMGLSVEDLVSYGWIILKGKEDK